MIGCAPAVKQLCIVVLLGLLSCADPVDKAAKARIFSPEDPPQAISAAAQRLPPEDVADKPEVARRVLGMGAAEATERLGPHTFNAKITFEWSGSGRNTRLVENRTLVAAKGGVSGDFHATLSNSNDQGYEVMRVHGDVFARSKYGKFRQRLRDRGMAERVRDETYGAIRDFDAMFKGRLKLAAGPTATYEDRTVWRYTVTLGPPSSTASSDVSSLTQRDGGVDETTRRRQHFFAQREPRSLQGEVLVDAQTSVVVKTHLDGRLGVASDGGESADLWLVLDSSITNIGVEPKLDPPTEFLPDQDKPLGIAAALERFGIVRAGADGGTAATGLDDEVEDDDESAPKATPTKPTETPKPKPADGKAVDAPATQVKPAEGTPAPPPADAPKVEPKKADPKKADSKKADPKKAKAKAKTGKSKPKP